jgi:hypothetical protein
MIAQKNVSHLFYTTAALATGALPTSAYQIGVRRIGESLCDASALVAGDQFQVLMMDANGKIKESPMYTWSNLIYKNITSLSALTSQVSSIGYNGTDGDIVATNLGNYLVTIGFRDLLKQVGGKRLYKFAEYQAGATAHNHDIAIALAGSLDTNMRKDAFKRIVPKAICSYAQVNGDCFDDDVYVVKGSKFLTFKTDADYSTNETVVVGDYIRLGAAGVAPTVSSPVYRVVATTLAHDSTDTIELDRPVTNATGTYVEGTFDATVIRKANAEAATTAWGLVLTGNDSDAPFTPGMFGPNLIMFTVGVSPDFSTTEVRLTTKPFIGEATYKQIAQLDWELQANNKEPYRIAEWLVPTAANILSSDTIDHLRTFTFKDNSTDVLGNVAESYMTLMIASDSTANGDLDTVFTQS